ncbi:PQQ-binding-like beta-propeller repeat protein [Shewanella sp. 1CM18E]|uniref:outer membrane protein assembly factor BamB family protein n=1 Tax=Shewanella sp. 1CM18E TaxID=2929169 RepID=UPI0020BD4ADD|nr:PQQ-binding-like beta-propeller repeat protein [Shewanella sp. 1CM18E]MCK8046716.1 PQQ-binding-like beta-propeller repeat protein [Shewanella sp. 1CM18E]
MKYTSPLYLFSTIIVLSACGGNGGSDNSNDNVISPTVPETQVSLQLTTTDLQINSHEGDALPVSFNGTWSASHLGDKSIYLQLKDETDNYLRSVISEPLQAENFSISTSINSNLQIGKHTSQVSIIACKDSNCEDTYTTSEVAVNIQFNVKAVPEWQTHQANSSHNGYVPIWLNNYNFKKLWEWQRSASGVLAGINSPVAGNGEVYLSTDVYFDEAAVIALDERTGEERWRVSFGSVPSLNPPAINKESLFVATSGHEHTKIWAIDRAEGKLKFQSSFSSQWGNYLAPTVYGEHIYQTGGYYGGHTYAFSNESGISLWSQSQGTTWGMDTAAVNEQHVYVHNGAELSILERSNGQLISKITDPFGNSDYDYHGSPVIGSKNNVLAFSGGSYSGRASSNAEHADDRVISNFDIENQQYLWSSSFAYKTFFAHSNGVIYAGKNDPVALDAIDEVTGKVLWSWVPPATEDTSFHRNVVVTKNAVFVSTNANVYAIDLESKESVWSYNEPGTITISDNRILFLAPGFVESDGSLIAFDLDNL